MERETSRRVGEHSEMRLSNVREELERGEGGGGYGDGDGGDGQGVWIVSTGTPLLEPENR